MNYKKRQKKQKRMEATYAIELSLFPEEYRNDFRHKRSAVEWAFNDVFNRAPTVEESIYWEMLLIA